MWPARSDPVDHRVDDPVEQAADPGRSATGGRPCDDEERNECRGEQHEGVLGRGLAAVVVAVLDDVRDGATSRCADVVADPVQVTARIRNGVVSIIGNSLG